MERVQLNLERLLPELRDLEKKKIFDKKEISEIVKRRTAFETALIRRGSDDSDWLQYIEYEKKLEQLRKIRFSKLNLKGRPTVSDYSIARHILSLYSSSVTRRPGSTKLWQSYIAHVIHNSNSSAEVSRVLARAIGLHPTNADIWLLAIRFEADGTGPNAKEGGIGGGNIDAARKLVMRALRFMKSAKQEDALKIWLEWIRLEISFVERMRKRWEILGINEAMTGKQNVSAAGEQLDEEMQDSLPSVEANLAEEAKEAQDLTETAAQVQDTKEKGQHAILQGDIVRVVIVNALSSTAGDLAVYAAITNLLRFLPTPLRRGLLSHTHSTYAREHLQAFTDAAQRSRTMSLLASSPVDDLPEPSKDGTSMLPVQTDSLEWIDALENSVDNFWTYIKACGSNTALLAALALEFGTFLVKAHAETADDDLQQFTRGHLSKLARTLRKSGLSGDEVDAVLQASEA